MLRLQADQLETLWDSLLPEGVRNLPDDLARLDQLLAQDELLASFSAHWERQNLRFGRPSIPMATYLRLMAIKHRTAWGYETLMQEVSDSLHLRRFCLIPLGEEVPDESTVRKLTRRLGPQLVDDLIREVIRIAVRERRFRPRAMRSDSTVVEADIRFPTDAGLTGDAVRTLARVARKVRALLPDAVQKVRDRSRAVGKRLRALGRSLGRRTGEAKAAVARFTQEAAAQVRVSLREARKLLTQAERSKQRALGVCERTRVRAIREFAELIGLAEKVVEQVRQRFAGEKISDRLVSLFDPDARPVRRGKLSRPNEFGYVVQLTELTANTRRGARGLILPPKLKPGSTHENQLLPETVQEILQLNLAPKEAAFDAGFAANATAEAMADTAAKVFIAGRADPASSRRTRRRLGCYRVGAEGRIAHVKREYGGGRSRLKGEEGARIWEGWAVLAYNADTVARMGQPS